MSWAERELEKIAKNKYVYRDRANEKNPEFVILAERVLVSLAEGIKKLATSLWFVNLEPGLAVRARLSVGRNELEPNFNVVVDYPRLSFDVISTANPNWIDRKRTVKPASLRPEVTEDQVDEVAAEVIGDFARHFVSPTHYVKRG